MILIGQYDSPFVRRVAIALTLYRIPFEHRPWSTFGDAEKIRPYSPMMRVPTLVLDDGEVLAIECRHHAGGRAYALERRLINLGAVPEAADVDFAVEPPGSWLLAHVPWTEAEHRITAFNAGGKELVALGIAAGAACMALERWTWRGDERITYARQVYPGDRYALVAHFQP